MNKPVKLPCILIINNEEINRFTSLGIDECREERVEWDLTFFRIDLLETPRTKETDQDVNTKSIIYSGGHVFACPLTEEEIIEICDLAGWFD